MRTRRVQLAAWLAAWMLIADGAIYCGRTAAHAAEPQYALEVQPSKRIHAVLKFTVEAPHLEATEWILFIGRPPVLPSQSDVNTDVDPPGVTYNEVAGFGRQVVRIRVPVSGGPRQTKIETEAKFDAQLYARHFVERKPGGAYAKVPTLTKVERDAALRKTPLFDFGANAMVAWLDKHELRRREGETDVALARRVFHVVVESCKYEYQSDMQRNASHVCTVGSTDCGGMVVLFAAALRANGVPARALVGCWAETAEASDTIGGVRYYKTHVKGEFYAEGIGWVPVDPSSAVLHDKTDERLRHFGHDAGNFLTMHVDPEIRVDSIHFGIKTLPWLQQFNFFVRGQGTMKELATTMDWQVEEK